MKIRLQCKQSAVGSFSPAGATLREAGDTFAKMLVGVAFVGVAVTLLCGAFSAGFPVIQSTRENLRATQIVMQKAEALRLFTWSQVCDTNNHRKPLFVEPHDSLGVAHNRGDEQYAGYISAAAPAAGNLANASRSHMRPVTVTLCWTNCNGAKPIVHTREMQARLARNGMPKYIWGAL
jgi:hypothetical protein